MGCPLQPEHQQRLPAEDCTSVPAGMASQASAGQGMGLVPLPGAEEEEELVARKLSAFNGVEHPTKY